MWSDPTEIVENMRWNTVRFKFTEEHFLQFKKHFDFDIMLRGHEVVEHGVQPFFNHQLFTVFSSGGQLRTTSPIHNASSAYEKVQPAIVSLSKDFTEVLTIDL